MCALADWHAIKGDAVHQAALAVIIVERIVPSRPVVPEGDRAFPPCEAGLELGPRRVLVKGIQQRLAFLPGLTKKISMRSHPVKTDLSFSYVID